MPDRRPRLNLSLSSRLFAAAAAALLATLALAPAAAAHDGADDHARLQSGAAEGPAAAALPLTSDNVDFLGQVPGSASISGCFAPTAPYFYTSGLESITVFDVSDPRSPQLTGKLVNALFENEAMNCGERRIDGVLHRFVLIGIDSVQSSPGDPEHYNVGGGAIRVVDVTDPTAPRIVGRADISTSTHTLACVDNTACRWVYTAGSDGKVSVIDLRDLTAPVEARTFRSPVVGWAGHNWDVDGAGFGLHTGAGGAALFDLTRPLFPRVVATTGSVGDNDNPDSAGWNDFILHNSWRPAASKFQPGTAASVRSGNVLLVTEEDYEDTNCATAGSFQTWKVNSLRGADGRVVPLDRVELADLGTFPSPVGAFCSAHWFDYHPSGLVAVGYYGGGLQVLDVRQARNIRSYGYATSGVSEVWDAYWVPRYGAGARTGTTNLVYTVDAVRGLDVYRVALPGAGGAAGGAADDGASTRPASAAVALAVLALPLALLARRRVTARTRPVAG